MFNGTAPFVAKPLMLVPLHRYTQVDAEVLRQVEALGRLIQSRPGVHHRSCRTSRTAPRSGLR
jgi:hypothetical protein